MLYIDLIGSKLPAFFKSICAASLLIISACSTPLTIDMTIEAPEEYAEIYVYTEGRYTFKPRVYISGTKVVTFSHQGFSRVYVKQGEASLSVRWQNYGGGGAPDFDGLLAIEANKKYYIGLSKSLNVEYYKRKINMGSEVKLVEEQEGLKEIGELKYIEPNITYLESKIVSVN